MAVSRTLLVLAIIAVAAGVASADLSGLGGTFLKSFRVSKAVIAARAKAFQQTLSTAIYAIVADTAGSADQLYAGDLGATGSCTFALVTSTNVTARVTINNMAGTGPPFKTYIRIGEGPYINRVVLGIPDINAGWANTTSTVGGVTTQTYTLITSWTEKDFFPRIPGWTLEEIFKFLDADANAFFCTIHTLQYKKGANRGNFTVFTPST